MTDTSLLRDGERLDEVNFRIRLIQKPAGLTYGTDALLLAGYLRTKPTDRAAELGGGSGIISLLALARDKVASVDCIEVQEEYADLIRRNALLNHMDDRLHAIHADLRDVAQSGGERGGYDAVFSNPPYMTDTSGAGNTLPAKNAARHECHGGIFDFTAAATRLLRYGGRFFCVFRPDRMAELFDACTAAKLAPKRMTLVHPHPDAAPNLLLLEATAGGHSGMRLTRPLFIYREKGGCEYTEDMNCLFDCGKLPQASE